MYKKITMGLLLVLTLALLAGCGKATPISATDFQKKMEDKKFTVVESDSQMMDTDTMKKILIATSEDSTYGVEFYGLSDEKAAKEFYNSSLPYVQSFKVDKSKESELNSGNHNKYTLEGDGQIWILSQIDSTLIYVAAPLDKKDEVEDIMKELGY